MTSEEAVSAGEAVMGSLLEVAHRLTPDDLAPTVARHLEALGMDDGVMCLVDLSQRLLLPLTPGREPLDVDATAAGRAFRAQVPTQEQLADSTATRLWVPLLDGADRIGVLGVTVASADRVTVARARHMASIAAGLVLSKSAIGDHLVLARRRRQTHLAAEMRWSTLPPLSFESERVAVSGVLEPAYEIAGDAFDYAIDGDVAHLAIIDAMGHGLEASRMANLSVAAYRHSRRTGLDLVDTSTAIDQVIADQFGAERFVTAQLAQLDLRSGRLGWFNAGHPRPLVLRNGRPIEELHGPTSLPLGLASGPGEVSEAALDPGDAVLFLTDGVVEARSPRGDLFGRSRLARLWADAAASGDLPAEILRRLCHSVLDHQQGRLQDDATLLLVVWHGPAASPAAVPGR